jgi:hypothetical protein
MSIKNQLTNEQLAALQAIESFLRNAELDVFILRGSAGTGKTTLIADLVARLAAVHHSYALLAPTGRAARILGNKIKHLSPTSGTDSATIHRTIYTMDRIVINEEAEKENDPGYRMVFPLKEEEPAVSLFVIDEASMIGDKESLGDAMQFGTGCVLKDLVTYARIRRPGRSSDHITKLLFVGDPSQLPPVGESSSPALDDEYLSNEYNLRVASVDLVNVMRQTQKSAILERATEIRDAVLSNRFNTFSLKPNQLDIELVDSREAINLVVDAIQRKESNVAVVHSNATACEYNRSIREHRWGKADLPIQVDDVLLVNKNSTTHSLSNGDLVKVGRVATDREQILVNLRGGHQVELSFRDVIAMYRDSAGEVQQTSCKVLENLLTSPHRELSALEQRALLVHFRDRYPGLTQKSPEFRIAIREDAYFNALQVKYGYAMTCHKAQGGEWNTVIVDFEANVSARNASFFRWAYTAITRAAKKLVVVNPPNFTAVSDITWQGVSGDSIAKEHSDVQDRDADPDWHRFSFSASTALLINVHRKLRDLWNAHGITVERLQHLQYCERYTLMRDGKSASIQYYYDSKFRVGKSSVVPGTDSDDAIAIDALDAFHMLANEPSADPANQVIQDFLNHLDEVLANTQFQRTRHTLMPYRLRVGFTDKTRSAEIDFMYDGSWTWTSAQEVGRQGNTQGLYQEIQSLMANYIRQAQ